MGMRRLYLDTSDLLNIADGKVDSVIIDELVSTMLETDTWLVVAKEHIQDVSKSDGPTKQRFIAAVQRFGPIQLVLSGPDKVEPWTAERADIVTEPCPNFADIVNAQAAPEALDRMNALQDAIHAADVAAQERVAAAPTPPKRKASAELFTQSAVTLLRRDETMDAGEVVAFWEAEGVGSKAGDEKRAVEARAAAFKEFVDRVKPFAADEGGGDAILRRVASVFKEPARSPGEFLLMRTGAAMQAEPGRERRRSDWLDLIHVAHLPYVDVATVDRQTRHYVTISKAPTNGPRTPVILPTGDLAGVIRALDPTK